MENLVCIMARAPMITHHDIEQAEGGKAPQQSTPSQVPASVATAMAS